LIEKVRFKQGVGKLNKLNKYYEALKEDIQLNINMRALMLGIVLGISIGYLTAGFILRGLYCIGIVALLWFATIPERDNFINN
jgi:hypothetical protein